MAFNQTKTYGLDSVKIGPIAGDGGLSTTLVEVESIVVGTPVVTIPVPTKTEIPVEDSDEPAFVTSAPGAKTCTFSTYNVDASILVDLFGGTFTGVSPNQIWAAPDVVTDVERSVVMTSRTGLVVTMPRVLLSVDMALNFQRDSPGQINILGTVLKPAKVGVKAFTAGVPAVG